MCVLKVGWVDAGGQNMLQVHVDPDSVYFVEPVCVVVVTIDLHTHL